MQNSPSQPLVLLVEDSEDDAFFFERTLSRASFDCQIERARNGTEAIDFFERSNGFDAAQTRPDLVFLDLKMPGMSGFEVLEWLNERDFDPPLHIIVLSGSDQESDCSRAIEMGANAYLVKPATVAAVKRCLTPEPGVLRGRVANSFRKGNFAPAGDLSPASHE